MDVLSGLDCVSSITDRGSPNTDLYSLQEINDFLRDTFGKVVDLTDYFPDVAKFIRSVNTLQRVAGEDLLDKGKRYHLQKHVTFLRKELKGFKSFLKKGEVLSIH